MLGKLYDRALDGERCWVRHDDGTVHALPVRSWLGGHHADREFDNAVLELCKGPTIDLGCGPGRLVARLIERGVPALGVDQSATAVGLARRSGAPALHRDVFDALPGMGRWQTVLLADGNVGLGGDPWRVLQRAGELLHVRVERQTLTRLPASRAVAFSLHTYSDPLSVVEADREAALKMLRLLEAYSGSRWQYSEMDIVREPLLAYLRQWAAVP